MTDTQIVDVLNKAFGTQFILSQSLGLAQNSVSQWKHRGIPAAWRPTIWALLEQRCPDVAAKLNRDEFLGVRHHLPSSEDAA